jgi:hypothetical protein
MLMGLELPALSAVVARLPDPQVHLAAFGGIVFPLALVIESPIIMMLAASTALSRDERTYRRLHRFMWRLAAALTAVHALVAFTPLYDLVAGTLIGAPDETLEPGRLGLQLMLPWTWAIADRRFHQGVLIRFGRSHAVGVGTVLRLCATCTALLVGYALVRAPGIAVAASALSVGVMTEAVYARVAVAPVLRGPLRAAPAHGPPMALPVLLVFYVPLALSPMLGLLAQPMGSAAMSRMPDPLLSLAAWPAVGGLIFLTRSLGMAFNEVVVSTAERPGALPALWRFTAVLGLVTMLVLVVLAATPLGRWWFAGICGLDAELTALAEWALWLGVLMPLLTTVQSLYQGILVSGRRTRGIPESMVLFLAAGAAGLAAGIWWQRAPGLYVAVVALTLGMLAQTAWLAFRCRAVVRDHVAAWGQPRVTAAGAPEFTE